jgi:hypothetical protein
MVVQITRPSIPSGRHVTICGDSSSAVRISSGIVQTFHVQGVHHACQLLYDLHSVAQRVYHSYYSYNY